MDGIGDVLLIENVEVIFMIESQAVALAEQAGDLLLSNFHPIGTDNLNVYRAEVFVERVYNKQQHSFREFTITIEIPESLNP